MPRIILAAAVIGTVCLASVTNALSASSLPFSGVWSRGDGNARVKIAFCGTNICATNLWIKDPNKGEAAGDRLVMTLKPSSAGTWSGQAYDAKRKLTYSMELTVQNTSMSTRGCIVGGLICKTTTWSRVH